MHRFFLLTAILLAATTSAFAQGAGIYITGGWSVFSDNTVGSFQSEFGEAPEELQIDNGVRIGARLAFNNWNFFGHEFSYAWQRSALNVAGEDIGGFSIHNVYYNFVAHATPEGSAIRPFVTGGGGISTFFQPGLSSFSGAGRNKFGYNYGGGIKFRVTDTWGIRLDVRDHVTGAPYDLPNEPSRLHNVEYSMGFGLVF